MVVSAMGKTTDALIKLAKEISNDPDKRELDRLMSTGEATNYSSFNYNLLLENKIRKLLYI